MNKLRITKINNYFKNKNSLLVFLLLIMGALIPSLSGVSGGFFDNLLKVLRNSYFNMFFFLASGLSVINMRSVFSRDYDFVIRNTNYKALIKGFIIEITLSTMVIYITAFILASAFSALFCEGNYTVYNYLDYGFNVFYYLAFLLVKSLVLASLVNVITFLLSNLFKKNLTLLLVLFNSLLFIVISGNKLVFSLYDFPVLYHYYFLGTNYNTFILEILCFGLQFIILCFISRLAYNLVTRKKRDL